jgi:hydrogenase nickel incorporation protein HypA/HybF
VHEYSIMSALIGRVRAESQARGAGRVRSVSVRIGELSGVDPVLLATAYEICREGSVCDGASLEIRRVPAVWSCPKCDRVIADGAPLHCGSCAVGATLVQGGEIVLERIEMEVPDV